MPGKQVLLVYDRKCPVCRNAPRSEHLRNSVGELRIVSARGHCELRQEITARGLDIDQDMVLKQDGQHYFDTDAIHALALLCTRSGSFNRLTYRLFSPARLSHLRYPQRRSLRNRLLKLPGRRRINNLGHLGSERY